MVVLKTDSDQKSIHHFCGYETKPTDVEGAADHLWEEMRNDSEFGIGDEADQYEMFEAPQSVLEYFSRTFNDDIEPQI